jgi:hypothetical protein
MHEVCNDIRNPKLWDGVKPEDMFGIYLRLWDRRVSLAFASERPRSVVTPREPLFPEKPAV